MKYSEKGIFPFILKWVIKLAINSLKPSARHWKREEAFRRRKRKVDGK